MAFNFGQVAKSVLGTVAPLIGTAIGGPFGGLAGTLLAKALGTADPKAMEAAIASSDPDILLKLKQADTEFLEHMKTLQITEEQLLFADTADARQREIAIKDPTPARLAWMIIGGFIVISLAQLAALMGFVDIVNKIPPQGWVLIGNLSGYLANEAKQVSAYYFGSSMGSQAKDATLADIAKSS